MSNKKPVILAVDDEIHILELIAYNLKQNGFLPITAESGEEALEILKETKVDLMLLDWMMDGMDGLEVLRKIRQNQELEELPVILLTAKSEEFSKVLGLELGADDFVSKPFGVHELMARIKAVLRRSKREEKEEKDTTDIIQIKDMVIDHSKREVTLDGKMVHLSLKEFELLYLLAKNRGKVFSRNQLLDEIWGYEYYGETRTVDVHIRNLRKKLEKDDMEPEFIKTVRGVGYKFL